MKNKLKSLNDLSNAGYTFAIIKIDEAEHWQPDIAKASGKIYGVYFVDLTEPTHCCELAISYPAENIKNFFPTPPDNLPEETLFEYEMSADNLRQDYMYLHGSNKYHIEKLYRAEDGNKEEVMEYERCNPTVC